MNEPYSEHFTVGDSRMMVFAMQHDDGKLAWIISSTDHNVQIQISGQDVAGLHELKDLKKAVDGAIKFLNDKHKEFNGGKEKNNDETTK